MCTVSGGSESEGILPVVAVLLAQMLGCLVRNVHELLGKLLVLGVRDQIVLRSLDDLQLLLDELVVGDLRESLEASAHFLDQVDADVEVVRRDAAMLEILADIDSGLELSQIERLAEDIKVLFHLGNLGGSGARDLHGRLNRGSRLNSGISGLLLPSLLEQHLLVVLIGRLSGSHVLFGGINRRLGLALFLLSIEVLDQLVATVVCLLLFLLSQLLRVLFLLLLLQSEHLSVLILL